MDQPNSIIAENLKKHRESKGLSLEQLAELTGVSKSMLRQIETGKSSPTISTIWKIANGLRVSFTSLLHPAPILAEVKSFMAEPPLTAEGEHYRLYPLIPFSPEQSYETYYFEIDPGTIFQGEPHNGRIFEYVFVTRGRLRIIIAGHQFVISAGEFVKFQADHPHSYECLSEETATAIMQVSYLGA